MASANDTSTQNPNVSSDILSALSGTVTHIDSTTSQIKSDTAQLKSIYDLLATAMREKRFSQSSADDYFRGSRRSSTFTTFRDRQSTVSQRAEKKVTNRRASSRNSSLRRDIDRDGFKNARNAFEEFDDALTKEFNKFSDGFADAFKQSLQFKNFHDIVQGALEKAAKDLGSDVSHLSEDFGRQMSQALFQESGLSDRLSKLTDRARQSAMRNSAIAQAAFNRTRHEDNEATNDIRSRIVAEQAKRMRERDLANEASELGNTSQGSADTTSPQSEENSQRITDAINDTSMSSDLTDVGDQLDHISQSVDAILNHLDPQAASDIISKFQQKLTGEDNPQNESQSSPSNIIEEALDQVTGGPSPSDIEDAASDTLGNGGPDIPLDEGDILSRLFDGVDQFSGQLSDLVGKGLGNVGNMLESVASQGGMLGEMAQGAAAALGGGAGGLGGALTSLIGSAINPATLAFVAIPAAIEVAKFAINQLVEYVQKATQAFREAYDIFKKELAKSSNFYFEKQRKKIETAQERLMADVNTMVKRPFEIMEAAAQAWYDTWDQNLRMIAGTQGYTKADLQNLMASYAERLRNEGLGDIVSAADMTEQLAKVLQSGLSGQVAEEFAYLATKLNAAIPNQDFFSYASEYASVAANAIQAGWDQSKAIELANQELEQFASNVLYASRMISGGFSTGLQNAQDLFAKSNQIARSAGLLDSSNISAVLTSVSSAVSAVAPQLADGLVSAVVDAAIGDNSESLIALRSLANTGASTTAFLREFASDPQAIFATIFRNLNNLQNMNADNYMEVGQALSSVFGIDAAAFSQVDFGALATSVQSMQVNDSALGENMTLLKSGETTTNDEQMRMQQINEMILNEGLSYVLDNQAARTIQQHMWDQELAQELMENTYGVELEGATFKLLQGIGETIHNIFNLLNPFSWMEKAFNVASVVAQTEGIKADIRRMLELGKVGAGNAEAFEKLTTYTSQMMNNVDDLVSMMEGTSGGNFSGMGSSFSVLGMFNTASKALETASYAASHPVSFTTRQVSAINAALKDAITQSSISKSPSSQYNWAYVGKSIAQAMQNTQVNSAAMAYTGPTSLQEAQSAQEAIAEDATAKMEAFLETMEEAAQYQVEWEEDRTGRKIPTGNVSSMSYDEWKETAADFGIEDLDAALEDYGMTPEELQGAYEEYQAQSVSQYNWQREMYEWAFWEAGINFWENAFPDEYRDPLFDRFDHLLELTTHIDEVLTYWEDLWQYDWFYQSWSHDWLSSSWSHDWLKQSWHDDWLKEAWNDDWLGDAWAKYWEAWFEWYFEHEVYSAETGQAYQASDVVNADADYTGDAILALAGALTQNTIDLKDPTVQTNALLAQILIVVEAIMQSENTSGSAALATTLAGLSLGLEG